MHLFFHPLTVNSQKSKVEYFKGWVLQVSDIFDDPNIYWYLLDYLLELLEVEIVLRCYEI